MSDEIAPEPAEPAAPDEPDEPALPAPPAPSEAGAADPEAAKPEPGKPRRIAAHTRRARTGAVAVIAVASAIALPLLVVKASRTIANSKAGRTATTVAPARSSVPDTPAALLVEIGADGTVGGLTLLGLDASGSGGSVIIVPAGTEWFTTGTARPVRLASAFDQGGGLDAQRDAVEGVLGITTSIGEQVDEAGLAALLAPYAPVRVTLDDRVLDTDSSGQERVLYPAGPVQLTAAQAAHVLLSHGPNESEIARLPRTEAVWKAVLSAAHATRTATSSTATVTTGSSVASSTPSSPAEPATVADQLAAIAGGNAAVHQLTVRPVLDAVENPDGLDLLAPDNTSQKLLMAELLPGAISPANSNIRFRLVNATGQPDLLAAAVGRLVFVGANVVMVSQAPSPTKETVIEYEDESRKAEATRYMPVVGPSVVRPTADRVDGIDATLVLGQDFAAFVQAENAKPGATSTTTPAAPGASTTTTT
jgi:hypothetical protein